jgi:NadR type nicotinamide-nucleotide adenylyltransferase
VGDVVAAVFHIYYLGHPRIQGMEKAFRQEPADILKIVLFGPESTGKTTLARTLASHYQTEWVPEFAREYLQKKWDQTGEICTPEDLPPIAAGQMLMENKLTGSANRLLICDTDLLVTKVYSEAYFEGFCDPAIEKYALENTYDLYLLTGIDVPWTADDLRDKPTEREEMFALFQAALERYSRRFVILNGSPEERLKKAIDYIDKLLIS